MERKVLKLSMLLLMGAALGCAGARTRLFHRFDPLKHQRGLFAAGEYVSVVAELGQSRIATIPSRRRAEAYVLLGRSYTKTGRLERALQTYQLAVGLYPKNLELLTYLADLLHNVGLDDRARPYYERVLSIHPNNAAANHGLAEILRGQGNLSKSRAHYEKTLEEWAKNAVLWRDYAGVLSEQRNFVLARTAIQVSLDLEGNDIDTYLAYARIERRHKLKKSAYGRLDKALSMKPDGRELTLQKSLWLLEDGRIAEARSLADNIIQDSPSDPLAHWVRASASLRAGRRESARADLKVAASAERFSPFVSRTARKMLESLGNKK